MNSVLCFIAFLPLVTLSSAELLQVDQYQCPTWFTPRVSNGSVLCECRTPFYIHCDPRSESTQLLSQYCMTYSESENRTTVGKCPYTFHMQNRSGDFVNLPRNVFELNEFMCGGLNRTGLLCSKCQPGLGLIVFSFSLQCMKCLDSGYGWLLYIFLATFPTTVLFLLILLFKIPITSGPLNAIIFVCQMLSISLNATRYIPIDKIASKPIQILTYIVITIYGIFNLDFFRYVIPPFCVSSRLKMLQVLSLEYFIAFYPLFLITVTYICIQLHAKDCKVMVYLWRPFQICFDSLKIFKKWDPLESLVHALVAFLLLSYSKILVTSSVLLNSNVLSTNTADAINSALYFDASVKYFGSEHLPFALLAILVLAIFIVLPVLILLLYPTRAFQQCLGCCNTRWQLALRTFVDAFQGCYKDGTADTPDWRCFSGLYLLFRIMANVNIVLWEQSYMEVLMVTHLGTWSLLFALFRPYKKNWLNILDAIAFGLLCFEHFVQNFHSFNVAPVVYSTAALPLLYLILYAACKLLSKMNLCSTLWKLNAPPQTSLHSDFDAHGRDGEMPDRVAHPEEYEELISAACCNDQNVESSVFRETDALPVLCTNSMQQYGSV